MLSDVAPGTPPSSPAHGDVQHSDVFNSAEAERIYAETGDLEAALRVGLPWGPQLLALARRMGLHGEAEDCVQDVWVRLLDLLVPLPVLRDTRGLLLYLVRLRAYDYLRARRRRRLREQQYVQAQPDHDEQTGAAQGSYLDSDLIQKYLALVRDSTGGQA